MDKENKIIDVYELTYLNDKSRRGSLKDAVLTLGDFRSTIRIIGLSRSVPLWVKSQPHAPTSFPASELSSRHTGLSAEKNLPTTFPYIPPGIARPFQSN